MNVIIFVALNWVFKIIEYAIFARVIVSWLPMSRDNQFIRLLYQITEPILGPIRSMLERSAFGKNMMMDFSPIIAILLIWFLRNLTASILVRTTSGLFF